jgi:hypothetical protein
MASKGIDDADERVIHQLLDFAHRELICNCFLDAADKQGIPLMFYRLRSLWPTTRDAVDRRASRRTISSSLYRCGDVTSSLNHPREMCVRSILGDTVTH